MRDREFFKHLADIYARPQVPDRYPHPDMARARARLLGLDTAALLGGRRSGGGLVSELPEPGPETAAAPLRPEHWLDPRHDHPADALEARRALGAVCLRTVFTPDSGSALDDLVQDGPADWHGPLVFACLLHLLGHEGARFWWQLAAAAGSDTAVYCLFLDHSRQGEYEDAEVWAAWLDHEKFVPFRRWGPYGSVPSKNRALPPTLTACLGEYDDDLLGVIPAPKKGLVEFVQELVEPGGAPRLLRQAELPERQDPEPATGGDTHSGWSLVLAPHRAQERPDPLDSDAIRRARLAERVVRVLEQHPRGVSGRQISRESHIPAQQLRQVLALLMEEEFVQPVSDGGGYAPGPALARLASPGGLATQLQHTLALARDSAGAAVYLSRYTDGEVRITQMADGPITPAVTEWVDFRAAAHASAVGKCLLTQLDSATRVDHLARYRAAALTPRTITSPRILLDRLERVTPNDPVYDLREYSSHTVCAAVPVTLGTEAGSLALSLPYSSAHRLGAATQALTAKAVPVLLTLLLAGAQLPADGPAADEVPEAASGPDVLSRPALDRLRNRFRTPLPAGAIRDVELSAAPGPHLAARPEGDRLYLFAADPEPALTPENMHLAVPHTYTTPTGIREGAPPTDFDPLTTNELRVFRT